MRLNCPTFNTTLCNALCFDRREQRLTRSEQSRSCIHASAFKAEDNAGHARLFEGRTKQTVHKQHWEVHRLGCAGYCIAYRKRRSALGSIAMRTHRAAKLFYKRVQNFHAEAGRLSGIEAIRQAVTFIAYT